MTENEIARAIVDAAIKIHKTLGPGLLESVYEAILSFELQKRGLRVVQQVVFLSTMRESNLSLVSELIY
jgi:GxxExxY protein